LFYCLISVIFILIYLLLFRLFAVGDNALSLGLGIIFLPLATLVFYPLYLYKKQTVQLALASFTLSFLLLIAIRTESAFFLGSSISFSESESNTPEINIGDMVVSRHYNFEINRNDFVGFTSPEGARLRKRVFGLPEETVYLCGSSVYLKENVPSNCTSKKRFELCNTCYFLTGVNTGNSKDSRYFGAIPRRDIFAKSLYKVDQNNVVERLTD